MIIKKYSLFLEELNIVDHGFPRGKSRKRFKDLVYDDPSSAKSPSSSVLLRNELSEIQFKEMLDKVDIPRVVSHILKIKKVRPEEARIALNNFFFLRSKGDKELFCEYCGRGPLLYTDQIHGVDSKWIVTCDHREPIKLGGDKFSYKNLAICCKQCNEDKGSMSYLDWIDYLPFYLDKRSGLK